MLVQTDVCISNYSHMNWLACCVKLAFQSLIDNYACVRWLARWLKLMFASLIIHIHVLVSMLFQIDV